MSKYDKLDALIRNALGAHPRPFRELLRTTIREADRLDALDHPTFFTRVGGYRYVERRLQSLKRAGKVRFVRGPRGGWVRAQEGGANG